MKILFLSACLAGLALSGFGAYHSAWLGAFNLTDVTGSPAIGVEQPGNLSQLRLVLSIYPNPFTAGQAVSFTVAGLDRSGPGRLEIFDLQGRLVRTFRLAGPERPVQWDLQDAAGAPAGSGIYFARLKAAGKILEQKFTVIR